MHKARLIVRRKETDLDGDLWEVVIWEVPASEHAPFGLRYRFAFVPFGAKRPAVLYDNHRPKGPHKHIDEKETPMVFDGLKALEAEFRADVRDWKERFRKPR